MTITAMTMLADMTAIAIIVMMVMAMIIRLILPLEVTIDPPRRPGYSDDPYGALLPILPVEIRSPRTDGRT